MIAPIVKEPDPRLHQKALPVQKIGKEIHRLIDTMIETMYAARGVGLAANQIGSGWKILVASPDGEPGKELVLINPSIEKRQGKAAVPEGCLSLPGVSAEITRAAEVTATGLDRYGKPVTVNATGLLAKILQHEVDHLEGHLFPDRLGIWKRRQILQKYGSLAEVIRKVKL